MKKVIFIGQTGSGKTTLCQNIHGKLIKYKKTQAVSFFDHAIDTPGEYIENRNYHHALIVSSADADVIGLVQDCTVEASFFPPTFAAMFPKTTIGVVTKVDIAKNVDDIERAKEQLKMAGASHIFEVSNYTKEGITQIINFLRSK